jgi:hypothetical protein
VNGSLKQLEIMALKVAAHVNMKKKTSKKPVAKKRAYRVVMPRAKKSNGTKILLALWVGLSLVQSVVIYDVYQDQFKEVANMVMAYAS